MGNKGGGQRGPLGGDEEGGGGREVFSYMWHYYCWASVFVPCTTFVCVTIGVCFEEPTFVESFVFGRYVSSEMTEVCEKSP